MRMRCLGAALAIMLIESGVASAENTLVENGGDTFIAGGTVTQTVEASGDVFVAGRSATVLGNTDADLHVSGFDVVVGADSAEDTYAAGFTVTIKGEIGDDLSAIGFNVRTEGTARVSGNARLAGATVVIDGPVDGTLTITGRDVVLNAPVLGDARIMAATIEFGPDASIGGRLTYSSDPQIDIPERVIPAARVTYEDPSVAEFWDAMGNIKEMPIAPSFASMLFGFLVTLLFFVLLAAIALGFFPKRVSWLRKTIGAAPWRTLLQGVIGLSMLFGSILVTGLTIVGLPFVPFALLAIVVIWTLAYALGAYAVAMRLWVGFGNNPDPQIPVRLAVFAAAIIVVTLLNYIPFVGWVANYTLVLLGVGAMTHAALLTFVPDPDPAMDVDMQLVDEATSSN